MTRIVLEQACIHIKKSESIDFQNIATFSHKVAGGTKAITKAKKNQRRPKIVVPDGNIVVGNELRLTG